jgi:hypothetical protein
MMFYKDSVVVITDKGRETVDAIKASISWVKTDEEAIDAAFKMARKLMELEELGVVGILDD